jgi:hypothetical protein
VTLGELLVAWQDEATILDALIGLEDLTLLARLEQAAADDGCDLASAVRDTVGRFIEEADDETWLTLLGRLGKAEDPAKAGLKLMLQYGLDHARLESGNKPNQNQ